MEFSLALKNPVLRTICMVTLGVVSLVLASMLTPSMGHAFFPAPQPPTIGSPPVYDAGFRAWQQTRFQKPWWKRRPNPALQFQQEEGANMPSFQGPGQQ